MINSNESGILLNELGKKKIINYLEKNKDIKEKLFLQKCFFTENLQKNGVDILSISEDNYKLICCFEIEVKIKNWDYEEEYNKEFVNISLNKSYLWLGGDDFNKHIPNDFNECKNINVYYIILNKSLTRAMFISGNYIKKYLVKPKLTNKRILEYIKVPTDKFIGVIL